MLATVVAATKHFAKLSLKRFQNEVHGGLLDIQLGTFGPEYANGGFHARLHFQKLGHLHITCRQQAGFEEFGRKRVASEANYSSLNLFSNSLPSASNAAWASGPSA